MIRTRAVRRFILAVVTASVMAPLLPRCARASEALAYEPPVAFDRIVATYTVNADGSYRLTSEVTLRILTPQGISSSGAPRISYSSSREDIESVEAYITQPDGTVTPVGADAIRTQQEDTDGGSTEFSDSWDKVILFPQVRVGSRLTWKYTLIVHTPIFKGFFSHSEAFAPSLNVGRYELTVTMPAGHPLFIETRGVTGGLEQHTATTDVYHFSYAHPTSEAPPDLSVADFDDAAVLRFSTLATPEEGARLYAEHAEPQAAVTDRIRELSRRVTTGLSTDSDRARALYQWVSKNIRYVAVVLGSGGYVPHAADEILAREYGDCKDHVTLLEALLNSVGIESVPALINLDDAYTLARIGSFAPFNHVINYLPSLDLYLDSTAQFAPFGTLPFEDADKPVLLTSLARVGHTPRVTASSNVADTQVTLRIADDGRIAGTSRTQMTGDYEISSRSSRFDDRSAPADQVARRILGRVGETGAGTLENVDPEDIGTPFWINADFSLDPLSNIPGLGALKVPSGLGPGVLARIAAAKPSAGTQRHPWPCISRTVHEHYALDFPATVRITHIPSPTTYRDPQVTYQSTYRHNGHTVEVDRRLVVERPTNSCPAAERERWRDFDAVLQRDLRAQIFYR
jgi:transglutaminase-like putative cysteine protease